MTFPVILLLRFGGNVTMQIVHYSSVLSLLLLQTKIRPSKSMTGKLVTLESLGMDVPGLEGIYLHSNFSDLHSKIESL